jgi:predicted nucleotidyltransferase
MAAYFARQPEVVLAYLFGSVAKGTARPESDVDVAVLFDAKLDPFERGERYFNLLGSALDSFANRPVDVRMLNGAGPLFCSQVVRHGWVIYERSRAERIAFQVFTMANYADTKPMRDLFTQVLYRRIQEGRFGERTRRHHPSTLEIARQIHERIARTPIR